MLNSHTLFAQDNSIVDGLDTVRDLVADEGGLIETTSVVGIIETVLLWMLGFIAILTLAGIIWGGIKYITALGDEKKIESAKKIVTGSVIGLGIVAVSAIIIAVIHGLISSFS